MKPRPFLGHNFLISTRKPSQWIPKKLCRSCHSLSFNFLIPFLALFFNGNLIAQESFPDMVMVKGGSFKMGSTTGAKNEQPIHEVYLDDFYLGRYEVTQAQWRQIMAGDTSRRYIKDCDSCPVERISWYNVMEFIRKLNQETGTNYRLPTEAEWEYAARGGKLSKGFKYSGSNLVDVVAWKDGNAGATSHKVGMKKPNELGIYDMTGNIFEWCSDWYAPDAYEQSGMKNPGGPIDGTFKVIRGGSWFHDHTGLRVTEREKAIPDYRYGYVGFRLCLSGDDSVIAFQPPPEPVANSSPDETKTCTITYLGNEGFLFETPSRKILIDALFGGLSGNWCDQLSDSISRLLIDAATPFDSIGLVLVTHMHPDHFNLSMTMEFMLNHGEAFLVCPEQVGEKIRSDERYPEVSGRIIVIDPSRNPDITMKINEVSIRSMLFHHGSWYETDTSTGKKTDVHEGIQNLAYLVEADGFSLLHSGDCSTGENEAFSKYKLNSKTLDAAFFDRTFLNLQGTEILNEKIKARDIILMHIEPGRSGFYKDLLKNIPDFYVFTYLMEKKTITR